ncbi:hypothetical protein DBR47_16755 [Paucibacter sp. KBW04]|uniref:EamA family transporter n=1 Tax=Paucibacter sp. KBW04 TaxID=2153361 RepID=UPI000F57F2CD|nr:EamA family transporter [Paucibacter sp. KBW04]RQO56949.1 hypothetical protein DBR47_16755 [Paucibacter sp. KBW04]
MAVAAGETLSWAGNLLCDFVTLNIKNERFCLFSAGIRIRHISSTKAALMKTRDLGLAIAVAALWGLNFSFIKLGVARVDPLVLAGLRFALTALPLVLFLPRPQIAWRWLVLYGLTFGVGTWGLVSLSLHAGLAPGLAAWLLQSSAFITPLLGVLWLSEVWLRAQKIGACVALLGFLQVIFASSGASSTVGVVLILGAAGSLSVANLIVKRAAVKPAEVLGFLSWSCLFAPLPLFALAFATAGSGAFTALPEQLGDRLAWASLAFQVYPTTLFGYWVWNSLMARYSAAEVAPVALLVPLFALLFAWLIFGVGISVAQAAGMGLILAGLLINTFLARLQVWLPRLGWRIR